MRRYIPFAVVGLATFVSGIDLNAAPPAGHGQGVGHAHVVAGSPIVRPTSEGQRPDSIAGPQRLP